MATATELRAQRDKMKADHKAKTLEERRELTDEIERVMKQVRRFERKNGLAADLPREEQPEELRALTDRVAALRAARAPHLRPVGLAEVQEQIRRADAEEALEAAADEAVQLGVHKLSDDELEALHHRTAAEFAPLVRQIEIISHERSKRAAEKARAERFKGMSRADKLAELEALKREVGGE